MARKRKPARLLAALATALNACDKAGLRVRLRHGIVMTSHGYVLQVKNGKWAARTLDYQAFPPSPWRGDEDD
jgi:hypothetical protein